MDWRAGKEAVLEVGVGEAEADVGAVVGGEEIGVGVRVVEVGLQAVRKTSMAIKTKVRRRVKCDECEIFGCMECTPFDLGRKKG
jgi:hypothetical protein